MIKEKKVPAMTGLEIAVIGMAGRFPGAKNIAEFWDNLKKGVESLLFISNQELENVGLEPELIRHPDYVKAAGGEIQNKEYFDAYFFDYSPREAELMDPQIRLFHECTWEALEDAGYDASTYEKSIGLFAGGDSSLDWENKALLSRTASELGGWATSHLSDKDFLVTRVSHKFNLKGPAVVVQTACSTSLVAIHMACRALLTGDCHMALAGGVSINLTRQYGYLYREGMINSADGHCRAFDANSKGTIGGNGVGIVALKPLQTALLDGDYIYAVIKGSAMNNDGIRKVGFTAPSVQGQAEVIRLAQRFARLAPQSITYIETHGTGTVMGDPIEIEALKKAFNIDQKKVCAIGSMKTNVGHLGAAAGVASFIKTVLAIKNRLIPPSLHFETPHPEIDFENSPFYVNNQLKIWDSNGYPLRAGISSFGIGGTNAHVILEEWCNDPSYNAQRTPHAAREEYRDRRHKLILLSAKNKTALDQMTGNLVDHLKQNPDINLANIAYTLQVGRRQFPYKRMIHCSCSEEVVKTLSTETDNNNVHSFISKGEDKPVVFMFSGQGSQYENMGWELYQTETVFREVMDQCFDILSPILNYNLKAILYPSSKSSPGVRDRAAASPGNINHTEIAQPLLFIFEYALANLVMKWGIKPHAMIGHSIGEYTAACLSGVFSLEDALMIVALRGQLMQKMPPGAMVSVSLAEEELKPLLNEEISLAAVNGPSRCVVSGPLQCIAAFSKQLQTKNYDFRYLHTSHAFHSPMMDPILVEFEEKVSWLTLKYPQIPYISNVSGTWITSEEATAPGYWKQQLRETVRFGNGIKELSKLESTILLEVGSGNTLSTLVRQHPDKKKKQFVLNLVRHPNENVSDQKYLTEKLGLLWLYGKVPDWQAYYAEEKINRIPLPTYPFERKFYWIEIDFSKLGEILAHHPVNIPEARKLEILHSLTEVDSTGTLYDRPELTTPYIAPTNETEAKLTAIWEDFLGIEQVGINDDFFELGGDSLKGVALTSRIQKEFNVAVPLTEVFNSPNIMELSRYIKQAQKEYQTMVKWVEEKEYYPLSSAQKRLYVLYQIAQESIAYNLPQMALLEGELEKDKFEDTFLKMISRYESLRTSFHMINEEPVQKINNIEEVEFELEYCDLGDGIDREGGIEKMIDRFVRPFGLSMPLLLRVGLIKIEEVKHIFMVDIHHIISDGTSMGILKRDFMAIYEGKELPKLKFQYKEFAEWQNKLLKSGKMEKQETYWLKQFEGEIPVINLPLDYLRPPIQTFDGSTIDFEIGEKETKALNQLASGKRATLYMVLMSIYNILLSKVSNQEDIVIGTPIAGRIHADIEQIFGIFINTLTLRNYSKEEKTFTEFLTDVRKRTLDSFENQLYQFEDLVEKLVGRLNRDPARNPLFDVMLILQNTEKIRLEIPDLKLLPYKYETKATLVDLILWATEGSDKLFFSFDYNTKLFKKGTIERFVNYFKRIVWDVIREPQIKLSEINILSKEEKQQLLYDFNDTKTEYFRNKTVHQLFKEQMEKTPDRIAIVGSWHYRLTVGKVERTEEVVQLTYRELNERSNRLAHLLRSKGGHANAIVGILVERSIELIIGILGVMKSGGAYLPLDPDYPQERIKYILKDSHTSTILTAADFKGLIRDEREGCEVIEIEASRFYCYHSDRECFRLEEMEKSNDLVYVIYTSGSTGRPKGVMIEHQPLINFIKGITNIIDFSLDDILFSLTTVSFDIFGLETILPLTKGTRVVIGTREEQLNPAAAVSKMLTEDVSIIQVTPSRLSILISNEDSPKALKALKYLLVGGETLSEQLLETIRDKTGSKIYNLYGPTETTIWSTVKEVSKGKTLNIGKPISNTRIYILGKNGALQPIGVPGELCIAGDGLARGYLNCSELTDKKFIPEPFFKEKRMYLTGDLARWLLDGNIDFLGRFDYQVKIRGFRIELGEIENQLREHESIKDAVVICRDDNNSDKYLCAYIVCRDDIQVPGLRRYLAQQLPDYMIPSYFVNLDEIPLTPNGKIDRKALHFPGQLEPGNKDFGVTDDKEYNEIELRIAEVWEEVLNRKNISINNNFFEIGGTSIKAITAVAQLSKEMNITINHFFQHGTIASIADNVTWKMDYLKSKLERVKQRYSGGSRAQNEESSESLARQFEVYNNEYINRLEKEELPFLTKKRDYHHILLTGGTGYLGAHLIKEILKAEPVTLYLLVRGSFQEESEERLKKILSFYFGKTFLKKNKNRLHVIKGNLREEKLGIDSSIYEKLSKTVDTVIHSAANVSHFGRYDDFYKDNVEGTERVLELAHSGVKKDFHFISTMGVAYGNIKGKEAMLFTEYCHDVGQKNDNVYLKSKLEAEKKILLYREKDLYASIYRVGNLAAHSRTGKFQKNIEKNAFYALIKAFIEMGIAPDLRTISFDMTFIDYVAKAIIMLMTRRNFKNDTYHLFNINRLTLEELIIFLNSSGISIKFMKLKKYIDYLLECLENERDKEVIERLLLHSGLFEEERESLTHTHIAYDRTERILQQVGFKWPKVNEEYIRKLVTYCRIVGFIQRGW